jgi:hypothetical protein
MNISDDIPINKLKSTDTDLLVNMIANTDKLVNTDKRWNYAENKGDNSDKTDIENNKEKRYDNLEDNIKLDSDIDDFIDSNKGVFQKDSIKENNKDTTCNIDSTNDSEYTKTDDDRSKKKLSKEDEMLLKLDMLRKLGELKQCGVHLSQNYNLESDIKMMEYEYKLHSDIKSKQNSVKWMSHMLIGILKGTEMLNDSYNPFDIKLEGLADKVGSDMHNYYSVLGEIYEKYNQPGKQMAPEMRLLLMISGAALSMQLTRSIPGMGNSKSMSSAIKSNSKTLNNLRKKAENDTKENDYFKNEHNEASKRVDDLKMLKEKELEFQKMEKMLNNNTLKNIKNNLVLSSEVPKSVDSNRIRNTAQLKQNNINKSTKAPTLTSTLTPQQIEMIKQQNYLNEMKHLEQMRNLAHQRSQQFRQNIINKNNQNNQKTKLQQQNTQLNNIINKFNLKDKLDSDEESNISQISVNPKIESIINNTAKKVQNINNNKKNVKKSDELNSVNNKLDKEIEELLKDDLDDKLSNASISFGSSNKKNTNKNIIDFGTISFGNSKKGNKTTINIGNL